MLLKRLKKSSKLFSVKYGGAVPAPYFGGSRRAIINEDRIMARGARNRRLRRRLRRGRGFLDFFKSIGSKLSSFARRPVVRNVVKQGTDYLIDKGTNFLFDKSQNYIGKTADKLRKKLGPKYSNLIDSGESFIRTGANKVLLSGRDYVRQKIAEEMANRFRGEGITRHLINMPSLKARGKMFSRPKRLSVKFGGAMLSGPIP